MERGRRGQLPGNGRRGRRHLWGPDAGADGCRETLGSPLPLTGLAMAVAVKHNQDTSSTGMFDRLPVALFMGVLYVFGSLGVLFPLLDGLWWRYVFPDRSNPVAWIGLLV